MRRIASSKRVNWRSGLREYAFGENAAKAASHWSDAAHYEFTADEIDRIEAAADEVHAMVLDAVHHVVERRLYALFGIDSLAGRLIETAWKAYWNDGRRNDREGGLFGRLDFAYDGGDSIKLLGCHYDGPTGLFESSIAQWCWLQNAFSDADQFNGLHEALVARWQSLCVGLRGRDRVHLTCATPDAAREGEIAYLAALAEEAGIPPTIIPIQELGWDGHAFRDLEGDAITWLLKLYAWESLVQDEYGAHLPNVRMTVLEPAWRMLASNHGLLATLWELYPEHPNLTAASLDADAIRAPGGVIRRSEGGSVYLAPPPLFESGGFHALTQVWMVGDKSCGMAVREAREPIPDGDAAFVPHLFR